MATNPETFPAHAVIAHRAGRLHLRSHHQTDAAARQQADKTIDADPLQVIPINLCLAGNGNVRLWTLR